MSDGRSVSIHSSVGATSAVELADKYQKLFLEFSKIKAQQTVLKKAVIDEQKANSSLQEELNTKEQELRTSLQQLDLLTFHNQRLTKRIENLQDSGNARLSPGWFLGSAKKELEKSKSALEETSNELERKIEENEKLHKELYEVNSSYAENVNILQKKLSELEKKTEELQIELTRSHQASEEAISDIRDEKRRVEIELDQTRAELRKTKSHLEENKHKMKEGENSLRTEMSALEETLYINLGLSQDSQSDKFDIPYEKIDSETNEIITSFRKMQSSARDYLEALRENSNNVHELGLQMKTASRTWQQNLRILVAKLASAQSQISKLTAERENLARKNENDVTTMQTEISRLREELEKQHSGESSSTNGYIRKPNEYADASHSENDTNEIDIISENESTESKPENSREPDDQDLQEHGTNGVSSQKGIGHHESSSAQGNHSASTNEHVAETDGHEQEAEAIIVKDITDKQFTAESPEEQPEESDEEMIFVYPPETRKESPDPFEEIGHSPIDAMDVRLPKSNNDGIVGNGLSSIAALERDTTRVTMSEGDVNREALIKKNYESKLQQLTEQLQLADSKSMQLHRASKTMQGKLQTHKEEISRLQAEKIQLTENFEEERANFEKERANFEKEKANFEEDRANYIKQINLYADELSRKELQGSEGMVGMSRSE